jgi:ligand-binding sensor domain-containing protein
VRNVFRDREGVLWLGKEDEAPTANSPQSVHHSTENGLVNSFVRALNQARGGSIWIGMNEGVNQTPLAAFGAPVVRCARRKDRDQQVS